MQITVISVGRKGQKFIEQGCALYAKRLQRFCRFTLTTIDPAKGGDSTAKLVEQEGERIARLIPPQSVVWLLDDKGTAHTSEELAALLSHYAVHSHHSIVFVIGGAWGLSESLKRQYPQHLSLSSMTLSHGLAKVVLVEQLYRAFSILHNLPYHHA